MEILSNFASIYCFITFIMGAVFMFIAVCVVAMGKDDEPRNKVRFYVTCESNYRGEIIRTLWLGKPIRHATVFCGSVDEGVYIMTHNYFKNFGLNENDYKDLKWEDEPIEVFLNLED